MRLTQRGEEQLPPPKGAVETQVQRLKRELNDKGTHIARLESEMGELREALAYNEVLTRSNEVQVEHWNEKNRKPLRQQAEAPLPMQSTECLEIDQNEFSW